MAWLYALLAVGLGTFLSIQTGINAQLRSRVGDPTHAALISVAVSAVSLVVYSAVLRRPWPDPGELVQSPWWVWTGGLLGAAYLALTLVLLPRLGAAILFSLVVVGQMLAALVLDHVGALGLSQHPVNAWRLLGVAFLVGGVALIRWF